MIVSIPASLRRPADRQAYPIRPIALFSLASILLSCSGPPLPAVGSSSEIGIVGNFSADDPRLETLEGLFGGPVPTAWGEPAFRLEPIPADARRNWKAHIILLDLTDPRDHRLTRSLLTGAERESWEVLPAEHAFYRDVWAAGQVVLLVHARDAGGLQEHVAHHGAEIYERFQTLLLDALREGLFAGGEEHDLEVALKEEHGFALRIPIGFRLDGADGHAQIKRIVPEEPKRWLAVHYGPAREAPQTPEEWVALRDSIFSRLRDGDRVLRSRSEVTEGRFQGHRCQRIEGIWQNETYVMGGPFRSYGFVERDRYYLVDLAVYHPPAPKLPALRQLDAIARTFGI